MEQGNEKPGAVILGGSFHSLGAARNLAKHGVPVCIMDSGACISRFSRAVSCQIDCPPADDEEEYVHFLLSAAEDENMGGWVVFPSTDETVRILARYRDRLGPKMGRSLGSKGLDFRWHCRLDVRLKPFREEEAEKNL